MSDTLKEVFVAGGILRPVAWLHHRLEITVKSPAEQHRRLTVRYSRCGQLLPPLPFKRQSFALRCRLRRTAEPVTAKLDFDKPIGRPRLLVHRHGKTLLSERPYC